MCVGKSKAERKRVIHVCKLPAHVNLAQIGGTEMPFIDFQDRELIPKRGDLVQSAIGTKRERTWFVLRVKRIRCKEYRYDVWMVRWWQLEPEMRLRLFRSAEKAGGQRVIYFRRYPAKRRHTFENYMSRRLEERINARGM